MLDAVIIGAGPSGLAAAILLAQAGRSVTVIEQRRGVSGHSRAIGIHPPGLAVLDALGVGQQVADRAIRITRGIGISRGRVIGALGFCDVPGRHGYIASLPQNQTLGLLRERLQALAPGALREGTSYAGHEPDGSDAIRIRLEDDSLSGGGQLLQARWLIGADGVDSAVRERLRLPFRGRYLPDRYVMGDFPDTTDFGATAVLFLYHEGIVECFPMPGNLRRWVAHVGTAGAPARDLARLVGERTGHELDPGSQLMHSEFTTANRQATAMVRGRVILVGDAAHEVSPIGGQGMTLGLLDVAEAVQVLQAPPEVQPLLWPGFQRRRLAAARRAARQAHLNMMLGRPVPQLAVPARDWFMSALAGNGRFSSAVARTFSMSN